MSSTPDDKDTERWWNSPFSAFQTNLREIDAGLDVDNVLDFIETLGANAWLLNTGGIISNYPTDLPFQTRNPALAERVSEDLVGDAVAAAKARDIRVICRMDFSKIPEARAETHPEWCFLSPRGGLQEYNGLVSVCPNGGYYRSAVLEVLTEVIGRYPVDAFFLNWFSFNEIGYDGQYHGVCHCGPCQRGYAAFAAADGADSELPDGPDDSGYERWQRFSARCLETLTDLIHDHIHAIDPNVALIRGDRSDIVWHEANNAVGRDLWPIATAEEVAVAKTWRPGKAVLINAVAFLDMPYRFAPEEPATMAQYMIQTISRGGNPSTYVMGTPDRIEYYGLDAAARIVRLYRDHRDWYAGLRPTAEVAVVRPDSTRTLGPTRRLEYEGIMLATRRAGIPVDIVAEEHLAEILGSGDQALRTVILGDLGELDPALASAVDQWVSGGGRILATGSTGLRTDGHDLVAAGIAGRSATRRDRDLRNSYVLASPDQAIDGAVRGIPLPLYGAYHYLFSAAETAVDHVVLSRAPFGPPEKCYGNRVTEHPGRLKASFGEGMVLTIPWTIGAAYRELELSPLAEHITESITELLGGTPRVSVDGAGSVDVSLGRNGDDLIIHVINLSGAGKRSFADPLPLPVELTIRELSPRATVEQMLGDGANTIWQNDATIVVEVAKLDTFEVFKIVGGALGTTRGSR